MKEWQEQKNIRPEQAWTKEGVLSAVKLLLKRTKYFIR